MFTSGCQHIFNDSRFNCLDRTLDKFIVDVLLNKCSWPSTAHLTLVGHDGIPGNLNCHIHCKNKPLSLKTLWLQQCLLSSYADRGTISKKAMLIIRPMCSNHQDIVVSGVWSGNIKGSPEADASYLKQIYPHVVDFAKLFQSKIFNSKMMISGTIHMWQTREENKWAITSTQGTCTLELKSKHAEQGSLCFKISYPPCSTGNSNQVTTHDTVVCSSCRGIKWPQPALISHLDFLRWVLACLLVSLTSNHLEESTDRCLIHNHTTAGHAPVRYTS